MDLNKSSIKLRPRNSWQAIDIGCKLALQWYKPLWIIWIASALPLALISAFFIDNILIAFAIYWWCKPAYEKPMIRWVGAAMFDTEYSIRTAFNNRREIYGYGLFSLLTWRRFSPARSFITAILQLEKLSGSAYRTRVDKLKQNTNNHFLSLTLGMIIIEAVLCYGMVSMVWLMLPSNFNIEFDFLSNAFKVLLQESNRTPLLVGFAVLVFSSSLVAPFFVCSGFSKYINSRTKLEAWDLDLIFQSMVNEKRQSLASTDSNAANRSDTNTSTKTAQGSSLLGILAIVGALILGSGISPSWAQWDESLTRQESRTIIQQVMEAEEFGKPEKRSVWRFKPQEPEVEDPADLDLEGLRGVFNIIKYLSWIFFAGFILWVLSRLNWQWLFNAKKPVLKTQNAPLPQRFRPSEDNNQLPSNILQAFEQSFQQQQYRHCLSLLYRGALRISNSKLKVEIPDAATEQHCLAVIKRHDPNPDRSHYFQQLTTHWITQAYTERTVSPEHLQALAKQWQQLYQGPWTNTPNGDTLATSSKAALQPPSAEQRRRP